MSTGYSVTVPLYRSTIEEHAVRISIPPAIDYSLSYLQGNSLNMVLDFRVGLFIHSTTTLGRGCVISGGAMATDLLQCARKTILM